MNTLTSAIRNKSRSFKKRLKPKVIIKKLIIHLVLLAFSFVFLMPFMWMLSTALKSNLELFKIPIKWIPDKLMWENFSTALKTIPFWRYTANTVIITFLSVLGTVLSASLVAYSFAKLRFRGRGILFVILLSTLMLPGQVTMIPLFIVYKKLNWINTYLPLTVPAFFGGGAFNVFLLRQFFLTIPNELSESARIDGASEFRIYWQVVMPLCKPALATVTIFTFMASWNDFFGPLIYLTDSKMFTLALGLRTFMMQYSSRWNLLMAASIVVMMPTLLLFFFAQKYFIEGITMTGIKG